MKRCEVQALVNSVNSTWNNGHLDTVIANVFNRLKKVLVLIIEADGGNDLVESKHGKKFANLDLPVENAEVNAEAQTTATTAPQTFAPPVVYDVEYGDEDDGTSDGGFEVFDIQMEERSIHLMVIGFLGFG